MSPTEFHTSLHSSTRPEAKSVVERTVDVHRLPLSELMEDSPELAPKAAFGMIRHAHYSAKVPLGQSSKRHTGAQLQTKATMPSTLKASEHHRASAI